MIVKINGESLYKFHDAICDSSVNATNISERMCDVSNIQIDMVMSTLDVVKEYFINVAGLF